MNYPNRYVSTTATGGPFVSETANRVASAQMGWRGYLSRPTWRILLYSAEMPPRERGLVLVDGVDGRVLEYFTEPNPEDWSDLTDA